MDNAHNSPPVPLRLKQALLVLGLLAYGTVGVWWSYRFGRVDSPETWFVALLGLVFGILAGVTNKRWESGDTGANPGGFEVLMRKDRDDEE